ncbi:hypothetical protein CPT_Sycamore_048 [Streptomyces phage Sycamore]|uniref:Uncharacterized protein n=1 Tax=Streptomyces phage Sycamore TaxID=2767589 RepID=A0A873WHI8_9CAUD|nr:hypothetical protein CPT_Sycamore_048 [Streptomyces phage Sycamore]
MMAPNRRGGFRSQVRITGTVAEVAKRRKAPTMGPRNSRVVTTNHLDALLPEVRSVVEAQAARRGVRLIDVQVISPTEALIP